MDLTTSTLVALAALVAGMVFGAASRLGRFCTLGAVSDLVLMGDTRRLRAVALALALAIAGSQALVAAGLVDLGRSPQLAGNVRWAGALLGGAAFGYGMTLAGGCGARALVRLGGGCQKSLVVVLVAGLAAAMTMRGGLAPARQALDRATAIPPAALGLDQQGIPAALAALGLDAAWARGLPTLLLVVLLAGWSLRAADFRADRRLWAGAVGVGLCVPLGWLISGRLGDDPFEPAPLVSFTFMGPLGDALLYLMTFSGQTVGFGVAAVAGVIVGAFVVARLQGEWRREGFADRDDLSRHLVGAALMGVGGVVGGGCTIGQGLTGMSTLSLTAPLAVIGLGGGAWFGLKALEAGGPLAAARAMIGRA